MYDDNDELDRLAAMGMEQEAPAPRSPLTPATKADAQNGGAVSSQALDHLAKSRPDLVEAYRAKMQPSNDGLADAREAQDNGNYGNTAGKLLNDYSNSQKTDVRLGNRMQDLGKAPTVIKADRPEYDDSIINNATGQGVKRAEADHNQAKQDFNEETSLQDLGDKRADQDLARQGQAAATERAQREMDPTSDESVQARNYLKTLAPSAASIPGFENMSAAKAREVAPQLMAKYKIDEGVKDRQQRATEHKDGMKAQRDAAASTAQEKFVNKETARMGTDFDVAKGRNGALGVAAGKVAKGEALQALANGETNLDQRQTEELAIGIQSLLSGSNAGNGAQVKALVPASYAGSAAKVKEWLTNEPTGLNQQAFIKKMMETTQREVDVAKEQIKRYQIGKLPGYQALKKSNPDAYNQVLQAHSIDPANDIDEKGQYKAPPRQSALNSEDQAAADWAKANPNDPRAAKILSHLGGQ